MTDRPVNPGECSDCGSWPNHERGGPFCVKIPPQPRYGDRQPEPIVVHPAWLDDDAPDDV